MDIPYRPSHSDNPYESPMLHDTALPMSKLAQEQSLIAQRLGFVQVASLRDAKGEMYRFRYDFWLSPTSDSLLLVSGGRLGPIPLDACLLFSRRADGTVLSTANHEIAAELDLGGVFKGRLLHEASLEKLAAYHCERIKHSRVPIVPYASVRPKRTDTRTSRESGAEN